jgi:hypothetical protein
MLMTTLVHLLHLLSLSRQLLHSWLLLLLLLLLPLQLLLLLLLLLL